MGVVVLFYGGLGTALATVLLNRLISHWAVFRGWYLLLDRAARQSVV